MKKTALLVLVIIISVGVFTLGVINAITNCSFWDVSAINCINTLVVIGISFFLVQRQNDHRKRKDIFLELLTSLKVTIDDSKSYNFNNVEIEDVRMRVRDIQNKLDLLDEYKKVFSISADVKFLQEKFDEYVRLIDNHPSDMTLLRQLQTELYRPINLMSQKILKIMLDMYK